MARLRCSSLNGRGIADFDEFIHKQFPIILRSCLEALYFDPSTLIEIAVYGKRLRSSGTDFQIFTAENLKKKF